MKQKLLFRLSPIFSALMLTTAAIAQDSWTPVELTGFGQSQNHSIRCLTPFKGMLYAATGDYTAQIYSSTNGTPGSWGNVFNDATYSQVNSMAVSNESVGTLFVADNKSTALNTVYRTDDGSSWSVYYLTTPANMLTNVVPYKGLGTQDSIYVFEDASNGTMIKRSSYYSNDPSDTSASWQTVFDFGAVSMYTHITSTLVYNGNMYFGTGQGGTLWKTSNGTTFVKNDSVGTGFGNANTQSITALGSYGGYIYAGTAASSDGAQIWRSNNETSWSLVASYPSYSSITSFTNSGGYLWATIANNGGAGLILKSSDGLTFVSSNNNGFGIANDKGNLGNMAVMGSSIFYACENFGGMAGIHTAPGGTRGSGFSTGGQIWRSCLGSPPIVNLGLDQTVCAGIPVTFAASGTGVSYNWCNGDTTASITTQVAGTYYCIVTGSNGCVSSDTVVLNNTPAPTVSISGMGRAAAMPPPSILCKGDSMDITGMANSNLRNAMPPVHHIANDTILDYATVFDTIAVSGVNDVAYLSLYSVTIDSLYHTYDNDMVITLHAPDGSYIDLSANHGSAGDNYMGTVFSTTGTTPVASGAAPFTGSFIPDQPFTNLSGIADGNWALSVYDVAGGDQGLLRGWTIRFSQADTILTFSWSPSTGLSSSSVLSPTAFPTASTVYALTTTNSIGCSTTDSIAIMVPKLILPPSHTICFGKSETLIASGGSMAHWSPATDLNTNIGDTVIATLSASHTYYVMDTFLMCPLFDSLSLNMNPIFSVTATGSTTVCSGDSVALTSSASGGSLPYNYMWNEASTTYPGQNIFVTPSGSATYTLTVIDGAGCYAYNATNITVDPSTDIRGHVSYSGGSVTNANAVIYKYLPYMTHFDTIQTVAVNNITGDYNFTGINHGTYLIEIFADTAAYSTLVPTYYGNKFVWDSATIVTHGCALADTLDITMIQETGTGGGPGLLIGQVLEGPGFMHSFTHGTGRMPGDPVPGIDVKLGRNPGGQLVTSGTTNSGGVYTFSNVAYNAPGEHYTVYVDIPGLGRDSSYSVVVDAANDQYLNLDYYVDTNSVYIVPNTTTVISNTVSGQSNFSVYPNPARGNATIEYSIVTEGKVSLNIYNVLGVKIAELVNAEQTAGSYKLNINPKNNSLNPGVYFITLIMNGKTNIHKIIITE
jgi:subtilisin-like proprotein convertase family protein